MWTECCITNAGAAILEQWTGGGTLTITGAKTGSGTTAAASLAALTDVNTPVQTVNVPQTKSTTNGQRMTVRIPAHTTAYTAKQIGIFGKLGSGNITLLAIYQDSTGISIPARSSMPDFVFDFYAYIDMSGTGTIAVTIDPNAYVTENDFETEIQTLEAAIAGKAASGHTHAQADITGLTAALSGKAASVHTHEISSVNGLNSALSAKATAQHTHVMSGVTGLNNALNGKAAANHTHTPEGIGAAAESHTHVSSDISGTIAIGKGGTGANTAEGARANLGAAATGHTHGNADLNEIIAINKGGTGASTAEAARAALGITLSNLGIIYSADEPTVVNGAIWLKPVE